MNFQSISTIRLATFGCALFGASLTFAQIPESDLESIFSRLNGDDYDARYDARIDLQNEVAKATAPGNAEQRKQVEAQLLERLASEELLTTRLWLLRQLESIGSKAALPILKELQSADNEELADAARMVVDVIVPDDEAKGTLLAKKKSAADLAQVARTSTNPSERFLAFKELSRKNARLAARIMAEEDNPDFVRVAMESPRRFLRAKALSSLENASIEKQLTIMGALPQEPLPKVEAVLLGLLGTEHEAFDVQVIGALGRVGSVRSLDALLERIEARSRDIRDAAVDALAMISDEAIDETLRSSLESGSVEDQIFALKALSLRASPGVNLLVNEYAANTSLDKDLRKEAISAMEIVGDVASLPILVKIVVEEGKYGLRRDAQRTLKRMSLRLADPVAAWEAFRDGFESASGDLDTTLALMLVSDSAPTQENIEFLESSWADGDESIQKMVLRVLPTWRNWDGGFALLDLVEDLPADDSSRLTYFKGVGKLILGSDATYAMQGKFDLAARALELAVAEEERESVISGFRYSTWRERVHVEYNDVDPELKEAVLEYAVN